MIDPCESCKCNCENPCWKVDHGIAVEVVRCRDCLGKLTWFKNEFGHSVCAMIGMYPRNENDFCGYGERRI